MMGHRWQRIQTSTQRHAFVLENPHHQHVKPSPPATRWLAFVLENPHHQHVKPAPIALHRFAFVFENPHHQHVKPPDHQQPVDLCLCWKIHTSKTDAPSFRPAWYWSVTDSNKIISIDGVIVNHKFSIEMRRFRSLWHIPLLSFVAVFPWREPGYPAAFTPDCTCLPGSNTQKNGPRIFAINFTHLVTHLVTQVNLAQHAGNVIYSGHIGLLCIYTCNIIMWSMVPVS